MSRYIDADKLPINILDLTYYDGSRVRVVTAEDIDEAPSIDIVRCGECKWVDKCSQNVAMQDTYQMYEKIDYCSYGERKESE